MRLSKNKGFSLVEVLIVFSLMGITLGVSSYFLLSTSKGINHLNEKMDQIEVQSKLHKSLADQNMCECILKNRMFYTNPSLRFSHNQINLYSKGCSVEVERLLEAGKKFKTKSKGLSVDQIYLSSDVNLGNSFYKVRLGIKFSQGLYSYPDLSIPGIVVKTTSAGAGRRRIVNCMLPEEDFTSYGLCGSSRVLVGFDEEGKMLCENFRAWTPPPPPPPPPSAPPSPSTPTCSWQVDGLDFSPCNSGTPPYPCFCGQSTRSSGNGSGYGMGVGCRHYRCIP